jgi:DNA-directed RNA polymerase subunit RPC12/RpoP
MATRPSLTGRPERRYGYWTAQDGELLRCPHCGTSEIATRPRSGVLLKLLRLFFVDPFRCLRCQREFFSFALLRANLRLRESGAQPARDVERTASDSEKPMSGSGPA